MLDYHTGELEVQARAGVPPRTSRVNKSLRPTMPPIAQAFLHAQHMLVLSNVDLEGHVWASVLTGKPGFIQTPDEQTIRINARPDPSDPFSQNLRVGEAIGMIAIDFATRKRMRVNGQIKDVQGAIVVHTEQVYSNCPKYIQMRFLSDIDEQEPLTGNHPSTRTEQLTSKQRTWIERADTIFIASCHHEGGCDISHRGGSPGFVRVESPARLLVPDYSGNKMYQTLGNISAEPHAGLLILDFESGAVLQLTGQARIIWEKERIAAFAGAERLVEFSIEEITESPHAISSRWQFVEYSPFLPSA